MSSLQSLTPSSAWVRFLRTYGPTPNNLTMFDEYVAGAVGRAKVKPIELSAPMLELMKEHISTGRPGSMLIAGTAGDGKTYHCRGLWNAIGGSEKDWADKGNIKEHQLSDGRMAVFIKDLSEFNGEESDAPLARLEKSVLGSDDSEVVIIAANHGQILDRLRDLGKRQNRIHPLRKPLQEYFLQAGESPNRLAVFDLSRNAGRKALNEVVNAVSNHSEWNKCESCTLRTQGKICPIFENRQRLSGANDDGQFSQRLGDLVEIARLNGLHMPTRDLLALCANMILGHKDAKDGLMSCSEVSWIQDQGTLDLASVYSNAFGANLPKRRLADRPVFKAMAAFGVGTETTNSADGLLVYGKDDSKLAEAFARLVGNDNIYGANPRLISAQDKYLEGEEASRIDGGANEFIKLLEAQRRRLFFTLPAGDAGYPFWAMTIFRFAGEFLEMRDFLVLRKPVSESTRSKLVRGLNRVMTGLLVDNDDRIFIASSGGFTQSKVSVLCDTEVPSRRQNGLGLAIKLEAITGRPTLEIALSAGSENAVSFDLTPVRFEFLFRVADGALPGSFSSECLEDMLAFKAKLLRKAELIRENNESPDDQESSAESNSITLNFIDIEHGGHAFSRPITVRLSS